MAFHRAPAQGEEYTPDLIAGFGSAVPGGGFVPIPTSPTPTATPTGTGTAAGSIEERTRAARRPGPHAWSLDWSRSLADPRVAVEVRTFHDIVVVVSFRTEGLWADVKRRYVNPAITVRGKEPYAILEFPPATNGECPRTGSFAYVYADIFERARRHLQILGDNPPPRWSNAVDVLEWQKLVSFNIQILIWATNIRPMFLFPTSTDPATASGVDPSIAITANWRTANTATKRSFMGYDGSGIPQFRDGARERWSHTISTGLTGVPNTTQIVPQSVLDLHEAMRVAGVPVSRGDAGFLERRVQINHDGGDYAPRRARFGAITRTAENTAARRMIAAAWATPTAPHDPTGSRFFVTRWVEVWDQIALAFAAQNLDQMMLDAIGFYVFNHNVWYADRLGMTAQQVRDMQNAIMAAQRAGHPVLGTIRAATASIAGAINPVAGAVVGILQEVGEALMTWVYDAFEADVPRPLFVRTPPLACREVELTIEEDTVAAPPGTVMLPPRRVDPTAVRPGSGSKGGGAALAAGAAVLAFLFWPRK